MRIERNRYFPEVFPQSYYPSGFVKEREQFLGGLVWGGVPRGGRPPTYLLSVELASIGVTPTYLPPPP